MNAAEAARWLIHTQAFDPAGTKTGVVDGGSRYGSSLGWCGQIGGVLPEGKNLRETLVLNLIGRDVSTYVRIGGHDDVPPWERGPDGPAWQERPPRGAIDLYTWQTRRLRLVGDRDGVVGVVLAKGDQIEARNKHGLEPHTAWRYNEPRSKSDKTTVYTPLAHDPSRSVWRGIGALLPSTSARPNVTDGKPPPFLAPGVLQWISDLSTGGSAARHVPARNQGVRDEIPSSAGTTYAEIVDDVLPLSIIASAGRPARGRPRRPRTRSRCRTCRLGDLDVGREHRPGRRGRTEIRCRLRRARAPLRGPGNPLPALAGDARAWRRHRCRRGPSGNDMIAEVTKPIVAELISAASPSAWVGREVRNQLVNVALAEAWFDAALRRALPLAQHHSRNTTPEEAAV